MQKDTMQQIKELGYIEFINPVVKEFAVKLMNIERILRIKIFQEDNGKFYFIMNYRIGTKPNATSYISQEGNHETIEEALWEAVFTSMMSFDYTKDFSEQMIDDNEHYE